MNEVPYFSYNKYNKLKYGQKAYRLGIDGGFSCPNRDPGDRNTGGCSYCESAGARSPYTDRAESLEAQISRGAAFLKRRYDARIFLLYFQAFSSTFAGVEKLKEIYDRALASVQFSGLIVSTRPDCITEEIADLLAAYQREDFEVWVELGLQSVHDATLEMINRGHNYQTFLEAFNILRARGLKITVHLILGLPGESWSEIRESVVRTAMLKPDGIKFHNLVIPGSSRMYQQYLCGGMSLPADRRYLDYLIKALELIPPETVVMRLNCDRGMDVKMAPKLFWKKSLFYVKVTKEMEKRHTRQGRLWREEKNDS